MYHDSILNKCLKRAARIILQCAFLTPSADMFSKLNWLSYSERVKYRKATLVFKCVNRMTPRYMTNLFTPLTHIRETIRLVSQYGTGHSFCKKNCYATSFAVSGAIMWNDLHPQLRTITCLTSFKRELRKTLC